MHYEVLLTYITAHILSYPGILEPQLIYLLQYVVNSSLLGGWKGRGKGQIK